MDEHKTPGSVPLVSVIIATYNRAQILRHALRSLELQTLTDWEVWVIGDGCTDESADVVASFGDPRMQWVNLPINSGNQSVPNNEGLRHARGRYAAFLGHDDMWFPWHLASLTQAIEEQGVELVYGMMVMLSPRGAEHAQGAATVDETSVIPPSSWLFRRELIASIGGWRDASTLSISPDRDVIRRLLRAKRRIGFNPRLSILKFESAVWNMYTLTDNYPQTPYLQELETDPRALHERILGELVVRYAAQQSRYVTAPRAFKGAFRRLYDNATNRYRDRQPFAWLLHRRYQQRRQRKRTRRGLR